MKMLRYGFIAFAGGALSLLLAACPSVHPTHIATLSVPDGVTSNASGSATGRLVGNHFRLEGSYRDLGSPVTEVLVQDRQTGQGIYAVEADGGTSGGFSRGQELTAEEVTALNRGDLEIVVYTEDHSRPDGSGELRGTFTRR